MEMAINQKWFPPFSFNYSRACRFGKGKLSRIDISIWLENNNTASCMVFVEEKFFE